MKTFDALKLFAPLQRAIEEQNYETPTPIQAQAIPPALEGRDILGCAQTGTGKTAAFALPILDFLGHEKLRARPRQPIALVLAPTRELAIQISDSFETYGQHLKCRQTLVYGGVKQDKQVTALRRGAEVLIATPGRLLDLMQQGHVDLSDIEIFVLDEADRMLDMGFLPELRKIIARLPRDRQSLFFSATLPPEARRLAGELLNDPVAINVTPEKPSVAKIEQRVQLLDRADKLNWLRQLLAVESIDRMIVFTRTKRGANQLVRKLEQSGITSIAIHGNKSQNARQKALLAFRNNQISILIATDVAARGIDVDGVSHVVNYDMPVEAESYVHRIGRTGRAGAAGIAISLCTPEERSELKAIERLIGSSLPTESLLRSRGPSSSSERQSQPQRPGPARGRRSPSQGGSSNRRRRSTSGRRKTAAV